MRFRWIVSGDVQGVGFRVFVWREAQVLKLGGTVRNLADGTVEVIAQGEAQQLAGLEAAIRRGPRHSRIANLEKAEISDEMTDSMIFNIM